MSEAKNGGSDLRGEAAATGFDLNEVTIRELLEAAPDAVVVVDRSGNMVLVNAQAERLFGYSRTELLGRPVEMLIAERHRARRVEFFAEPGARATGAGLELNALRKDGTEFPAELRLSAVSTAQGRLVSSTIRDITERKILEVRSHEADRLKSEFLANMSHELRTPLNAILGFAELMHAGKVGELAAQHKEFMGDILTSARHLLQLINDVLDLSKVESGKMELRPEEVDLQKLIQQVRDIVRGLAAKKRLRLEHHVDERLSTVVVDPARVKQILYNYLANGIEFTPTGGRVTVRALVQDGEYFRIEVEDTGAGIAPECMDKLFVEFQQVDPGASRKYPGTGLGLALARRVAEAHGGRVEVRSEPGKGSVFSAILPRRTKAGGGRQP